MAEIDLPVLRSADSVEKNLTDNARYNILPARYTSEGEDATQVFERVAKNVALAELLHVDADLNIIPSDIKEHPHREQIIEDVFWEGAQNDESAEVPLDEDNIKYLDYDKIVPSLVKDGYSDAHNQVTQKREEFQDLMESLSFMPNSPTLMNAGDELQQLSACVAGHVPVYTSEGLKDMEDVEVGDYVLTHKNRFKRVLSHEKTGEKDTWHMSSGTHHQSSYTLEATPDHEVFTGDGWEELEHIEDPEKPSFDMDVRVPSEFRLTEFDSGLSRELVADGGVVKALNKVPDRTGTYNDTMLTPRARIDNDEKLAYLFGAYISEGNVNGIGGVRFTLNRGDDYEITKIGKYLRDVFGLEPSIRYREQSGECTTISLGSKIVGNFFEEICGQTFDTKTIPDFVASTSEEYKREFLSGLNLDGHRNSDNWSFQFANPTLTYEALMLGRSLGYDGTFNYRAENKLSKNRTAGCRFGDSTMLQSTVKKEANESVPVYDMTVEDDHSYLAGDYFVHNCFVISPDDEIYDIHETAREAAEVFQSGGGMGYGFWTLRPKGEPVGSTGGIASGPITFMRTFDQMCETIAQGGARRGAQMGVMKVDHPDVIEFIHAKRKDVSLAETLRLNDPDDFTHNSFEGALEEAREILDSDEVPHYLRNAMEGHLSNFNISVGVTDDFMEAVKNDELFTMRHPDTNEKFKANPETVETYELFGFGEYVSEGEVVEIPARKIWEAMVEGAHENGEPGTVFIDRFNDEHSFPVDTDEPLQEQEYSMLATNPCVTGDTKVATADGRGAVQIKELVGEKDVPVYTRKNNEAQVGLAKNIRKTREDAELVEIETDGDASLTLTPDHPVWTRNRGWVDAGELEQGDSLHILYETDHNSGYRNVQWTGSRKWNLEHRMVAEDILDMDIDDLNVHHKNGDKQDNRPENLDLMDPAKHGSLHSRDIEGENNPLQVLKERGEFEEYKKRSSFYDVEGEDNPMYGKSHSEKTKEKIGDRDYTEGSKKASETLSSKYEDGEPVTCKECGDDFKALGLHLRSHDMSVEEYKEEYGEDVRINATESASNHTVVSVKSAGSADVYDLEVPGTRNFYASQEGGEYINIHNCGEQPLMEYEACNLGHINLSTIVSHDLHNWGEFKEMPKYEGKSLEDTVSAFLDTAINWKEFNHRIKTGTNFLDNVVTMSDFPIPEIEESVRKNRKIGLGIMGLAQMYIQLGVEYGSEAANEIGRQLMTHINHKSKHVSHEMALERGSFDNYLDSKYADPETYPEWFEHHTGENVSSWRGGFPIRNHNTTTVAPTGTTSMIGNTSGGCEPIYSVANFKNVSGDIQGDEMLEQFDSLFLKTLEVNDIDVEAVKEQAIEILQADEWEGPEQLDAVPQEICDLFVTTGDLTALEHSAVQCAIQDGVDSAISKTVNAPHDASIEDAKTAFEYVYDHGGKGVTYYRDGTRSKQVLTTSSTTGGEAGDTKSSEEIARDYVEEEYGVSLDEVSEVAQDVEVPKTVGSGEGEVGTTRERPNTLEGQTYRVETGYGRMYVTVNDLGDEPFEILATIGKSGGQMESMLEGICRMVSASFRSGMNAEEVIEQLRGIRSPKVGFDNGEQIQSIPDGIAKVLVRHTGKKPWLESQTAEPIQKSDGGQVDEPVSKNLQKPDDSGQLEKNVRPQNDGEECPECHKMTLKMIEGCKTCETCGWSAC